MSIIHLEERIIELVRICDKQTKENDALKALVVKKDEALRMSRRYSESALDQFAGRLTTGDSAECDLAQETLEKTDLALALTPADLAGCVCVKRKEWQAAKDRIDDLISKNIEGANLNASLTEELRVANENASTEAFVAMSVRVSTAETKNAVLTAALEEVDAALKHWTGDTVTSGHYDQLMAAKKAVSTALARGQAKASIL